MDLDDRMCLIKEVLKMVAILLAFEAVVAWSFIAGSGVGHLLFR